MTIGPRLRSLWRAWRHRATFERRMSDEMAFHLDSRADDLVRRGLTRDAARRQARLEFGNPAAWRDRSRDARGIRALDELRQDLRFAWRSVQRRKLTAAVIVLTLTFGIGISSGVFTMLAAAMLRPQLPDPEGTFVAIHTSLTMDAERPRPFAQATLQQYEELRDRLTAIRPLAASRNVGASIDGAGSERVLLVSCNFFEVYGIRRAATGRLLDPHDCERGEPVVVLAQDSWQRRFDSDPAIVGRSIAIAGVPFTVVGVIAGEFAPDGGSAWLPYTQRALRWRAEAPGGGDGQNRWLNLSGRLAYGVPLAKAQAEAAVAVAALDLQHPRQHTRVLLTDGALVHDPNVRGNVVGILTLVMGALTALVLIVCANVATLLLSQAAARHQEVAIRLSMGAGRGRLIRMLLTETLALAACAGVASYFVALAVPPVLLHWMAGRPAWFPMAPDWRVFVYLTASVLLAGLAAGLAPAWESLRTDILTSLKGQRTVAASASQPGTHAVLVAGQVALGFILLSGAALFLVTHYQTLRRDAGYASGQVLMPRVSYRQEPAAPSAPGPALLRNAIAPLPGVRTIAFAATAPGFTGAHLDISRADRPPLTVESNEVSPEFFKTIDLPILRGRALEDGDGACRSSRCAAVVSEALSRMLFPAGDAVGGLLRTGDGLTLQIVGVAADTSAQTFGRPDPPALYLPWTDDGRPYQALVRFDGRTATFAARVGARLRARFPGSVVDTHTLRWPLDLWLDEIGSIEQLVVALGI